MLIIFAISIVLFFILSILLKLKVSKHEKEEQRKKDEERKEIERERQDREEQRKKDKEREEKMSNKNMIIATLSNKEEGDYHTVINNEKIYLKVLIMLSKNMIDLIGINNNLKNLNIYINKQNPHELKKDLRFPNDEAFKNLSKWIKHNQNKWILIWNLYVNQLNNNKVLYLLPDEKEIVEDLSEEHNKHNDLYNSIKGILGEKILNENNFKVIINSDL